MIFLKYYWTSERYSEKSLYFSAMFTYIIITLMGLPMILSYPFHLQEKKNLGEIAAELEDKGYVCFDHLSTEN